MDVSKESHLDLVEGYLEEVVQRLFDVTKSLEALQGAVNMDKIDIAKNGQDFRYQQGIIDVVTELHDYAIGKRSLIEDIKDMKDAIVEEVTEHAGKKEQVGGMFQ